jgi:hypothetical protein
MSPCNPLGDRCSRDRVIQELFGVSSSFFVVEAHWMTEAIREDVTLAAAAVGWWIR